MARPPGRQLPKIIAASPMNPRPAVCPSTYLVVTKTRNTPPRPASAPEMTVATYLVR